MNDQDLFLIEKYIAGELQGENLILFEKRLKEEDKLAIEYQQRLKLAKLWADAAEYEKTKKEIAAIFKAKQKNFFYINRYYIISVAASIVLLLGVYFLLLDNKKDDNGIQQGQFATTDSLDRINEKTIQFQMNKPAKFASVDSVKNGIKLFFPNQDDVIKEFELITFKWESSFENDDTLFICSYPERKILLKLRIQLSDSAYTIKYPQLLKGNYIWYISDSSCNNKFKIVK